MVILGQARRAANRAKRPRPIVGASLRRDWSRAKLGAVAVLFAMAWLGLWAKAFQIQVMEGPRLAELVRRQHLAMESMTGRRGQILDRHGALLATSVDVKSVFVRPYEVKRVETVARTLAPILQMSQTQILKKLRSKTPFVWIDRQVSDKTAAQIAEAGLPGVHLSNEFARQYPNRRLAGQLLGFVGLDDRGLEGLESYYDDYLAGGVSSFLVNRDASGRRIHLNGQGAEMSLDGRNLHLTLDMQIQYPAEEILAKTVQTHNARWGGCMMVEVATGEILAWAQYPFFNPNNYSQSNPSLWRNKLVMDAFEAGSTMKPFLVAAAMAHGIVTPETEYFCENGRFMLGRFTIRDTHEYGALPVHKILRYSSNICVAKIGLELGAERYHDFLTQLGFGQKTGLPLPGESTGILRPPKQWQKIDLATASFGQSFSTTVAQIAQAYLCIASGGVFRPLILTLNPPPALNPKRRVMSSGIADQIRAMLAEVVEEDGTGTKARIPGMRVCGKTGTAQKASSDGGYGKNYMSSFAGFFPAEAPKYLIVVVIDEPHPNHYGGVVAAPAFQELAVRALAYRGDLPDADRETLALEDDHERVEQGASQKSFIARVVQSEPLDRERVPDLRGYPVRQAVEVLLRFGVVPDIRGEGLVVSRQEPSPGGTWPDKADSIFTLWLTSS